MAQISDYPQTRNFVEADKSNPITDQLLAAKARPVRNLRHVLKMDRPFNLFDDRFCASEQTTALRFAELTYGLSQAQINDYLGKPDFISSADHLLSPPNSQCWIYVVGRTPLLMRLVFNHGKCIQLSVQPYDLDELYCKWRHNDLVASATGKTRRQLLREQGPPKGACDLSLPPGLSNEAQIDFWLNALKTETIWTYDCGDLWDVTLFFKDNICRGQVSPGPVTLGYTEERTQGATFKMPPKKH
jgi:hypothetical protein